MIYLINLKAFCQLIIELYSPNPPPPFPEREGGEKQNLPI